MTLAVAAIGWGLFVVGAVSHLTHFDRFVDLLRVHVRAPRPVALAVVGVEAVVALIIPLALITGADLILKLTAAGGAIVGLGFTVWILRLLASGSTLPCACSLSEAPTSRWSLARAGLTVSVGLFALVPDATEATAAGALVVGLAAGLVAFMVPDAVAWPEPSMRLRSILATTPDDAPSGPTITPVALTDGPNYSAPERTSAGSGPAT